MCPSRVGCPRLSASISSSHECHEISSGPESGPLFRAWDRTWLGQDYTPTFFSARMRLWHGMCRRGPTWAGVRDSERGVARLSKVWKGAQGSDGSRERKCFKEIHKGGKSLQAGKSTLEPTVDV